MSLFGDKQLNPIAVLWFYDEFSEAWKLMVASDVERTIGPRATYAKIRSVLEQNRLLNSLPLRRVIATSPRNPVIVALRTMAKGATNLTISDVMLNGILIPGAYIYKIT